MSCIIYCTNVLCNVSKCILFGVSIGYLYRTEMISACYHDVIQGCTDAFSVLSGILVHITRACCTAKQEGVEHYRPYVNILTICCVV